MSRIKKILIVLNCMLIVGVVYFLFLNYPLESIASKKFLARRIVNIVEFELLFFAMIFYRHVVEILKNFFMAKEHPLNLAVIRIVIFAMLFNWDCSSVYTYSAISKNLMVIPKGLGWLESFLVFDPPIISVLVVIFKVTCAASILGLFSRYTMLIAALLSVYLLGIPQLFGKINHYHHVVWFALILAVSPSYHIFSLDSYFKKRKGQTLSYGPSMIYGAPIRFMWIMVGYLYFSAGFPKWWFNGIDWVFSNSLAYRMYFKWMDLPGIWTPAFRIDHHPILLQASALGVILFEVSFIFLIFLPKLRYVAVFSGIIFHQMTRIFLKINFIHLQICYVIFFNWHKIFQWIGIRVFKKDVFSQEEVRVLEKTRMRPYLAAPIIISVMLLIGNFYCGARGINSWPVTTYPAFFQVFDKPYFARLEIIVTPKDGEPFALRNHSVINKIGTVNYVDMVDKILLIRDSSKRDQQLRALWEVFKEQDVSLQGARIIEFYRATFTFVPEERHKNPLYKKLIYSINN